MSDHPTIQPTYGMLWSLFVVALFQRRVSAPSCDTQARVTGLTMVASSTSCALCLKMQPLATTSTLCATRARPSRQTTGCMFERESYRH